MKEDETYLLGTVLALLAQFAGGLVDLGGKAGLWDKHRA
jgi:hypothetical protein